MACWTTQALEQGETELRRFKPRIRAAPGSTSAAVWGALGRRQPDPRRQPREAPGGGTPRSAPVATGGTWDGATESALAAGRGRLVVGAQIWWRGGLWYMNREGLGQMGNLVFAAIVEERESMAMKHAEWGMYPLIKCTSCFLM